MAAVKVTGLQVLARLNKFYFEHLSSAVHSTACSIDHGIGLACCNRDMLEPLALMLALLLPESQVCRCLHASTIFKVYITPGAMLSTAPHAHWHMAMGLSQVETHSWEMLGSLALVLKNLFAV